MFSLIPDITPQFVETSSEGQKPLGSASWGPSILVTFVFSVMRFLDVRLPFGRLYDVHC